MSKLGPVGIDFGTTKTAFAYYDDQKEKQIISFPTTVLFADEQERHWESVVIGKGDGDNPIRTWKNFKPYLGNENTEWQQVPPRCHPERLPKGIEAPSTIQLTALVLREIKRRYCEIKRENERWDIGPTTITTPAFSTFKQRQALIFAAKLAGFDDISLVEEPVAAYLMHHFKKASETDSGNMNSLVIDFGGGTLDLALIASKERSAPEVLGTYTVKRGTGSPAKDIGGNDIEDAIIDLWKANEGFLSRLPQQGAMPSSLSADMIAAARFAKEKHNPKPGDCNPPRTFQEVSADPLSSEVNVEMRGQDYLKGNYRFRHGVELEFPPLERGAFFNILDDPNFKLNFKENLDIGINHLLAEQHLTRQDVGQIILVGGSCYIRRVLQDVRNSFTDGSGTLKANILFEEPEFAIAYGALNYKSGSKVFNPAIRNKLSMSIYIEVEFDPKKDTNWLQRGFLANSKFIRHENRHYIELARRGLLVEQVNGVLTIPFPIKSRKQQYLKIYQVKPSIDKQDYKNIRHDHFVEEIPIPIRSYLITFLYWMDQLGNFYRSAKPTIRFVIPKSWRSLDKEHDWDNQASIEKYRQIYFQEVSK